MKRLASILLFLLCVAGGAAHGASWTTGCTLFDKQSAAPATGVCGTTTAAVTDVVSCATETDFYFKTLPANLMGTNHKLKVQFVGTYLQNAQANDTLRIRAMLSGVQIANLGTSANIAQSSSGHGIFGEFTVAEQNSTSVQMTTGHGELSPASGSTSGGAVLQNWTGGVPSMSTVDTTGPLNLELRVLLTTLSASIEWKSQYVYVEICP